MPRLSSKNSNMGKPKKKPSVRKLIQRLDTIFSIYIRRKYADKNGYVSCFTCGIRKHWKEMQNSHYISRSYKSLRFDERNCHPACVGCNVFKHGAMDVYALKLQAQYGDSILYNLQHEKHKIKQFTVKELEELIELYTKKTKTV